MTPHKMSLGGWEVNRKKLVSFQKKFLALVWNRKKYTLAKPTNAISKNLISEPYGYNKELRK